MTITKIAASMMAFLLVTPAYPQMNATFDLACFRYDASQVYTEIYYAVPLSSLKFQETEIGDWQAQALIRFSIFKNDSLWREEAWKMEKRVAALAEIKSGQAMVDVVRYVTAPGNYRFVMSLEDLHSPGAAQTAAREISLANFPADRLSLSQIELASTIKNIPPEAANRFYKNGLEVIPKPDAIFGAEAPLLYYYVEAYNLSPASFSGTYRTQCQILDATGQPAPMIKPRVQTKRVQSASAEAGMFNIAALPTGVFILEFAIVDSNRAILHSTSKRFYVYHPDSTKTPTHEGPALAQQASREYRMASEEELDEHFAHAKYIADREEVKAYKSLTSAEAKRQFLTAFWQKRDPTASTARNEFKLEYDNRLAYANQHLQNYTRAGWKTDRGRVYLVYGPPDDVERFSNNALSYAYEIWHYDQIEGGVIFVFVQLQSIGEYVQMHSTKRGEPQNKEWEAQIKK